MADIVEVDFDALRSVSNGFKTSSLAIKTMLIALTGAVMFLRATAFVSKFSGMVADRVENEIKPPIENLMKSLDEMADDLLKAIEDMSAADDTAKQNFEN
jgi:uncharacterized protein YukE